MTELETLEIRSFRSVFDLERRIYRIDRFRLNPSGVPVRGVVYLLVLVVLARVLAALPLAGAAVRMVPWWLSDLLAPTVAASVLAVLRIDGRPAHVAVRSLVAYAAAPRRLTHLRPCSRLGATWAPPDLTLIADGSEGTPRRLRYRGPGTVLIRAAHVRERRPRGGVRGRLGRPALHVGLLAPGAGRERDVVVALAAGAWMEVGPAAPASRLAVARSVVARSTASRATVRRSRWW